MPKRYVEEEDATEQSIVSDMQSKMKKRTLVSQDSLWGDRHVILRVKETDASDIPSSFLRFFPRRRR
jgi:hypothetical protein